MPFSSNLAGPLRPEITVKYFAVSLIFLNSGLSLKTEVNSVRVAGMCLIDAALKFNYPLTLLA